MSETVTVPTGITSLGVPPEARQRKLPSLWALVPVLALVNAAAIWGQAGWASDHIVPERWAFGPKMGLALAFAAAIELIGVFLAQMADEAESRNLAAGGIRIGSYAVGLFSGALNFSHFLHVTFAAALAFGFLSSVSPFLWGIYSRVKRGAKIAPSRRIWHPIRSITLLRYAAWEGLADEDEAKMALELEGRWTKVKPAKDDDDQADDPRPTSGAGSGRSRAEIGREAIAYRTTTGESWEKVAAHFGITPSYLYKCRQEAGEGH